MIEEIESGAKLPSTLQVKQSSGLNGTINQKTPPQGTFEKTSFDQLMRQYDLKFDLPPTIELTQAFLMTQNMKEAASRVSGLTAGGANYFLKNDYVGDTAKMADAMQSVNRLLANLGTQDKASNFLLEQKNLMRAQSRENKDIRDAINQKIVDGLEYVRVKEQIAETKSRVKELLEEEFSSDEDEVQGNQKEIKKSIDSDTQEDSQEHFKRKLLNEKRIALLIKQLRKDASEYLSLRDGADFKTMPLHKICQQLRGNELYRKKRESKALQKGMIDIIKQTQVQLQNELKQLDQTINEKNISRQLLIKSVAQYEQVFGLEKRLKADNFDKSISEIDALPMNSKSYELQNILFNFCGIGGKRQQILSKRSKDFFANIKKLPSKSTLLQSFQDQGENKGTQNENNITSLARKKNIELVKVIGLEPEKLFQSLNKYTIRGDQMPKFSNVFERAEPIVTGINMTVANQVITGNQSGQMNFARIDGRSVISLQFSPFEMQQDNQKKKLYEATMKDILEQRDKIKSISKQAREKQEISNIKRAWLNIVKKDIPKAFRSYQKYKADLENNNKKQSQNCLKEVRKKAIKTQRLVKEIPMRAKKLTREMMNFWKRRDKEMADLKRKKEKVEKEIKRKQEEEKEALFQKKRLEFIMKQSEIYAHFMSKKLGLADEQQKQRQQDLDEESKGNFQRVDVDDDHAKKQIAKMINDGRSRVHRFDTETLVKKAPALGSVNEDELEIGKMDNPDTENDTIISAPSIFKGSLKPYQLKGLKWLFNLYEQGINGILADDMGLGKTIQTISLIAHLYETKGVWGPFLIIVPVTTLHNWQNELAQFCPTLKVLPYFGNPEERKKLGRFLDPKNLYNPAMQINVLLTSYNLIVNNSKDQQKLLRVKWHYMILDEAQAIKNNLSRRWKILLQFNARNRLLLTGTPIQNTMAELWALLHFIMPNLFDSHEQFQEWFSKDIEQHSNNQGEINKHQLRRLHLVLKPFMLRRLKKDVEAEIGPKFEYEQYVEMTHRQRILYNRIKSKISTKDLFQLVDSKQKMENLMNLVMQFRKVCNHPELFERRVGRIPYNFRAIQCGMQPNINLATVPDIRASMKNPIVFEIPKLIYDECFFVSDNNTQLFKKSQKGLDECFQQIGIELHMKFFNIFNTLNLQEEAFKNNSGLGILQLYAKSNNLSYSELSYLFVADSMLKQVAMMHYFEKKLQKNIYYYIHNNELDTIETKYNYMSCPASINLDISIINPIMRDPCSLLYRRNKAYDSNGNIDILSPLVNDDITEFAHFSRQIKAQIMIYVDASIAEPISLYTRSGPFNRFMASIFNSSMHKKILLGKNFKPKSEINLGRVGRDRSSFLSEDIAGSWKNGPPVGYEMFDKGLIGSIIQERGSCVMELPNYSRLVSDCAKMQFLDKLLTNLVRNGHRCLIFCQMTRMLDILEDFISWRKYTYFRMDGSTSIQDRRYMVEEYQKNNQIFAFLLSTRAGGLGVNLTGADTVIFYDNDWNPTMDAQACDRAHRIGQTKTVSVYRIITKRTVEEKIVKRARQKQNVQSTVYGGNVLKADVFRPREIVDMLLDERETETLKERGGFIKTKRVKKGDHHHQGAKNAQDGNDHKRNVENQVPSSKVEKIPAKKEEAKKPGRKPANIGADKATPTNAQSSLFSTIRSENGPTVQKQQTPSFSSGPFNISKAPIFGTTQIQRNQDNSEMVDTSKANNNNQYYEDEGEEYDDYEEDEEDMLDEDEIKRRKLLEMLERDESSDDDDGMAIKFDDDALDKVNDDGESIKNGKNGKSSAAIEMDLDEDDADVPDDY